MIENYLSIYKPILIEYKFQGNTLLYFNNLYD